MNPRTIQFLTLALLAACLPALATTIVSPVSLTSTEGNNSNTAILGPNARTLQYVYSAAESGLTAGDVLLGLSFRLNVGSAAITNSLSYTSYSIDINTTTTAPGSLSTTFATNQGVDDVTVYSGTLFFAASSFPTGGNPNSFGPEIHFSTPFLYTGNNLVVTIRTSGNNEATTVLLDTANNLAGSYQGQGSSVGASATVANGATSTAAVMAFDVTTPEPSTGLLLIPGLLGLIGYARRRA